MDQYQKNKQDFANAKEESIRQQAKEQLTKELKKRILTSFIFALAEIEKNLGHLWGEDLGDDVDLTESQSQYDTIYEKIRKNILDNGNKQSRLIDEILNCYDITWTKNKVYFIRKDDNGKA